MQPIDNSDIENPFLPPTTNPTVQKEPSLSMPLNSFVVQTEIADPGPEEGVVTKETKPGTAPEDILLLESDPLLRRAVRQSRLREDEGAVEYGARLFISGYHMQDAAELARVSERRIRTFLKTDNGKMIAKELREELDEEFKSLYGDAIEVLRDGMRNPKAEIRLNAANNALRYLKDIRVVVDVSAEDLVQKIMRGGSQLPSEDSKNE